MSAKSFGNQGMRCEAAEAQLFDYVDAVLPSSEAQAISAHLAECDKCQLEVEHIRRAESALLAAPLSITPPGDLYAGFADKLAAHHHKAPWIYLRLNLRYVAPAVALATIALVLFRSSFVRPIPLGEPTKIVNSGSDSAAISHTRSPVRLGRDRALAVDSRVAGEIRRDEYALGLSTEIPIRNRKRSSKHRADIALLKAKVDHPTSRVSVQGVIQKSVNGVQLADNMPQLEYEAAKYTDSVIPFAAIDSPRASSAATNLYAYTVPDQRKQIVSRFRFDGMSVAIDVKPTGGEFALVVQDDVRGFTAEAHNTDSSVPEVSHTGASADDGFKVEVEFDGAAGTTSF